VQLSTRLRAAETGQHSDAIVEGVSDVDVARTIHSHTVRIVE
jgi:hypothetical protein